MKQIILGIICFSFLLLTACKEKQMHEKAVTVTIEPQRFFAEKIAGENFKIYCIVPSGQSPETYDPTPKQMIQVGKSLAYLQIGYIGFEQVWMKKIREGNPDLRIFDMSEGMDFLTDTEDAHADEGEAEGHHHHAGGVDPHIWSSVTGAKVIARNTRDAFIALDKANADYYQKNYEALLAEIDRTESEISALLDPLTARTFIIYHPALTYFAHEFRLTQLCIEMDGKEPSPAQLKKLVETARENGTRVVFIQQEFDRKNAELIARETDCRLVTINPLDYHWNKEMIHIAKALADGKAD